MMRRILTILRFHTQLNAVKLVAAWLVVFGILLTGAGAVHGFTVAQEKDKEQVSVVDQPIVGGTVTVAQVVANRAGWLVIHAQDKGAIGPVIGFAPIQEGVNDNVMVTIESDAATETLYAMLHVDRGEAGVYEFPGPDGPVLVNGAVLAPSFQVTGELSFEEYLTRRVRELEARIDSLESEIEFLMGQQERQSQTAQLATTHQLLDTAGFHALDSRLNEGGSIEPGDLPMVQRVRRLMQATEWPDSLQSNVASFVDALNSLATALDEEDAIAAAEWAESAHNLQHDLSIALGEYLDFELGLFTPQVLVNDQEIKDGSVTIDTVIANQAGWLVIHADKGGTFGAVIGFAPVSKGVNENVTVSVNTDATTETLYAMLHVDAGQPGVYEFPGPDGPVSVEGSVLAPSFQVLRPSQTERPSPSAVTILIQNVRFGEGPITVPVGTTVTWINADAIRHTVTSPDGLFDSGTLLEGDEFSFTFTEPGEFNYYCRFHGTPALTGMASKIVVGEAGSQGYNYDSN